MNTADWYSSWFDTDYYHILYKDRDEEEAGNFVRNLVRFLDLPVDACILDLACGKGRHSVTLNHLGYPVVGADLSENSIQSARRFENDRLHFIVHDMREELTGYTFGAVLNLFTSFGYFDSMEDNLRVIQSVHRSLEPDGILVIDFMNTHKVIRDLVGSEQKTVDGIRFDIRRSYDNHHVYKTIHIDEPGKTLEFTERVQALTADDFKQLFSTGGFELIRTFGDFDLSDYDPEHSNRLILIARKN